MFPFFTRSRPKTTPSRRKRTQLLLEPLEARSSPSTLPLTGLPANPLAEHPGPLSTAVVDESPAHAVNVLPSAGMGQPGARREADALFEDVSLGLSATLGSALPANLGAGSAGGAGAEGLLASRTQADSALVLAAAVPSQHLAAFSGPVGRVGVESAAGRQGGEIFASVAGESAGTDPGAGMTDPGPGMATDSSVGLQIVNFTATPAGPGYWWRFAGRVVNVSSPLLVVTFGTIDQMPTFEVTPPRTVGVQSDGSFSLVIQLQTSPQREGGWVTAQASLCDMRSDTALAYVNPN
jgi:hypothetical protein